MSDTSSGCGFVILIIAAGALCGAAIGKAIAVHKAQNEFPSVIQVVQIVGDSAVTQNRSVPTIMIDSSVEALLRDEVRPDAIIVCPLLLHTEEPFDVYAPAEANLCETKFASPAYDAYISTPRS
jgi:hypothetical protein